MTRPMTEETPPHEMTEWLKVLLEEIERKKEESARAGEERRRRAEGRDESQLK